MPLIKIGRQTYNLNTPTSKLFLRTFLLFKSTLSLTLKADAKIKSICLTIQVKIQKYFRELICFEVLLHKGSAIAFPSLMLSLKAAANIQLNFTLASFLKK
jgi:hypothetical protein